MIHLKNEEEIELIRVANQLVSKTLAEVGRAIKPGVTTMSLDTLAEQYIRDNGGIPSFKGYEGFPSTLCVSVNEEVVHGFPSDYVIKEGDIVSIDCGAIVKGFNGDSAYTFPVGEIAPETQELLDVTKESLYKGIAAAKVGGRIGDISFAVQNHVESHGMGVVREMVGHGLGREMHEDPQVPNYGRQGSGTKIKDGLVICIEPMITQGSRHIVFGENGWTVSTKDHKPAAHYELCVACTQSGVKVLSTFKYIDPTAMY